MLVFSRRGSILFLYSRSCYKQKLLQFSAPNCTSGGSLGLELLGVHSKNPDETGEMPSLVRVYVKLERCFKYFVMFSIISITVSTILKHIEEQSVLHWQKNHHHHHVMSCAVDLASLTESKIPVGQKNVGIL